MKILVIGGGPAGRVTSTALRDAASAHFLLVTSPRSGLERTGGRQS
jgi:hypothetical protein